MFLNEYEWVKILSEYVAEYVCSRQNLSFDFVFIAEVNAFSSSFLLQQTFVSLLFYL